MSDRSGCGLVELAVLESLEVLTAGRRPQHNVLGRVTSGLVKIILRGGLGGKMPLVRADRRQPEGSENQRAGGEWSAVETLRHLVFVHDSWFRRCCLGSAKPFTAIGLASEFVPGQEEQGLDRAATPSLDKCWPRAASRAPS
jgi:hypothetical protein